MERLYDRCTFEVVTSKERLLKLVAKSNFVDATIMKENVVITRHLQTKVYQDRPCYLGAAILDLVRLQLAKFHLK